MTKKLLIPGLLVLGLVSTGCKRSEEATPAEPAAPAAAASPEASTAPDVAAAAAVMPPYTGHDYACEDGAKLNARLEGGNIVLTLDGQAKTLAPTAGATGASYSGEGVSFIAQGETAMLLRDGQKPANCTAQ